MKSQNMPVRFPVLYVLVLTSGCYLGNPAQVWTDETMPDEETAFQELKQQFEDVGASLSRMGIDPENENAEILKFIFDEMRKKVIVPSLECDNSALMADGGFDPVENKLDLKAFLSLVARTPNVRGLRLPHDLPIGSEFKLLAGHPGIAEIHFHRNELSMDALRVLPTLPELQDLFVTPQKNADEAMAILAQCRRLRVLTLRQWKLSNEGLAPLAGLRQLKRLDLSYTPTSHGISALKDVPLEVLDLSHTPIDDVACESIAKITTLRELILVNSPVTDAGIEQLSAMHTLEELLLSKFPITARGLEALVQMPRLRSLSLFQIEIGDPEIAVLCQMKNLRSLSFWKIELTADQLQELRDRLPDECELSVPASDG